MKTLLKVSSFLFFIILLSCSNKNQNNITEEVKVYDKSITNDVIDDKYHFNCDFELSDTLSLKDIELIYEKKSKHFNDSIWNKIKILGSQINSKCEDCYNVYYSGSESSYEGLRIMMDYNNGDHDKFVLYALIMAEKYDYSDAYYDVFSILRQKSNKIFFNNKDKPNINNSNDFDILVKRNLDYLNDEEKAFALLYLIKAYNRGNTNAAYFLSKYYNEGRYFPKDSICSQIIGKNSKK